MSNAIVGSGFAMAAKGPVRPGGPLPGPGGVVLATPAKSGGHGGPLRVPGGVALATPAKPGGRGGPLRVPGGVPQPKQGILSIMVEIISQFKKGLMV